MSGRVDFRAEPEWIELVEQVAKHMGMGLSAYIRMATNERLARDGARPPVPQARDPKQPRGRKGE
jgi:hypothetical protein